jgi:small subunit ribosomal protein S17
MTGKRKTKLGRVVSNKMDKTAVVAVESFRHHPIYRKTIRRVVRYKAHDENNACSPGDAVRLEETRPLSREKRWRVVEILEKAVQIEVRPEEIDTQPVAETEVTEPVPEDITESEPEETGDSDSIEHETESS